jgi:tetratricopeptide (TPR) repeat protein
MKQRPWLKKLIWLGSGSYSRDPECLALNNLGAAEIKLGEFESARRHLEAAIAVDRQSPLPYFNLGALARLEGNESEAARLIEQAAALGYSRGLSDRLVTAAQDRFSKTSGQGLRQDSSKH